MPSSPQLPTSNGVGDRYTVGRCPRCGSLGKVGRACFEHPGYPGNGDTSTLPKYAPVTVEVVASSTSSEEVRHGMMPGSHERMQGPECRCGRDWPCPDVAAPSTSSEEASSTSEARRGRLIPTGVDAFARCLACGGLLRELQRTEAVIDARCDDCGDETQRRTPARRRAAPFSTQQATEGDR